MARGPTVFDAATYSHKIAATIADPSGGVTIDANARTAINSVLAVLRRVGIIAGAGTQSTPQIDTDYVYVQAPDATVTAGGTVDTELRTAVNAILAALRSRGLIGRGAAARAQPTFDPTDQHSVGGAAIANPSGGATVDANARTTINSVLAALRSAGIIAN